MSEDHNLSRCHILENPVTKFRNSEKMFHKILLQYANMIYAAAAFENFLSIKRKVCMAMLPGADPGEVGLCTPDAPADDAGQEPAVVLLAVNHQGPSGVTLGEKTLV